MPRKKTDWPAIKLEYVNSNLSLRELADRNGIKAAGVMARAAKEGWDNERKQKQAEVSKNAQEQLDVSRSEELAKFNEDDLRMARAIRGRAAQLLQASDKLTAGELRAVASSAAEAQKIGRLALGAETAHTINVNQDLTPKRDEDFM